MSVPKNTKTRVVSDTVERYTIWDNFERHVQELTAIGATPADIEPLRAAAAAVDIIEKQIALDDGENPELQTADLGSITSPHACANGWIINPPSAMGRRWAKVAVTKITGGAAPEDRFGLSAVVLVGLWVLREFGKGNSSIVMPTVTGSGNLANLVMGLTRDSDESIIDGLVDDYMRLMGFEAQKKRAQAMAEYAQIMSQIRTRLSAQSTVPS